MYGNALANYHLKTELKEKFVGTISLDKKIERSIEYRSHHHHYHTVEVHFLT